MNINDNFRNIRMGGIFTADLINIDSGQSEKYSAPNLVLDSAYVAFAIGAPPYLARRINLGSSAAPVLPTDTALKDFLAFNRNNPDFIRLGTYKWRLVTLFESHEANGEIREVGVSWDYNPVNGMYLNRALFVNPEGMPITIVKTSSQLLRITLDFEIVRG